MNCDQVFFVLTSGPFPTGSPSDLEVERHLESCPGCWRIANALRPAADVFQEAIAPTESRRLPGYWGDACPPTASHGPLEPGPASADFQPLGPSATGAARTALVTPVAQRRAIYRPAPPPTAWRDVGQVTVFLAVVATAVFGLTWLFGM